MSNKTLLTTVLLVIVSFGSSSAQTPVAAIVTLVPQYDLTIRVLPDAHRLEATGTMQLPAIDGERVSHHTWCGEACFDSRRRVNSTVRRHSKDVI